MMSAFETPPRLAVSVLPHSECGLDFSDREVDSPSNFVGPYTIFSGACFICSVHSTRYSLSVSEEEGQPPRGPFRNPKNSGLKGDL